MNKSARSARYCRSDCYCKSLLKEKDICWDLIDFDFWKKKFNLDLSKLLIARTSKVDDILQLNPDIDQWLFLMSVWNHPFRFLSYSGAIERFRDGGGGCCGLLPGVQRDDIHHQRGGCGEVHPSAGRYYPEKRARNEEPEWDSGRQGEHQSLHAGRVVRLMMAWTSCCLSGP